MGAHGIKLNKGLFLLKNWQISNVSRSAAPELALVPASRYYCDAK